MGTIENDAGINVAGPIGIDAVCFDADGALATSVEAFANKDALRPGETANFSIDLFGDECYSYLMGASGFTG